MSSRRVVVVGASRLGCRFALAAQATGHDVTLLDEHPQRMKDMALDAPYFYGTALPAALLNENAVGQAILESNPPLIECFEAGVDVRLGTIAWGAFQNSRNARHIGAPKVGLVSREGNELLGYEALVVTTGSRDFVPSFQGWDLPGVFGVKAGVALLDAYQCYEGRRTIVLGTGRRAVDFARRALKRGVAIAGLVDPSDRIEAREEEAWLKDQGVAVFLGHTIEAAEGATGVTAARLVATDGTGRRTTIPCDTVCIAISALPNIELPAAMGCRLEFRDDLAAWTPAVSGHLETSLPGVFWLSAFNGDEEQIPRILKRLEFALDTLGDEVAPKVTKGPRQADSMRHWVETLNDLGGDVVLCQCEGVTRAEFLDLQPPRYLGVGPRRPHSPVTVGPGAPRISQDATKRLTRVGMGHCQGRRCRDEAALLLSLRFGIGLADIRPSSYRFPVRAVDLDLIAGEDDTPDTRERWSMWLHAPEQT